MQAECTSIGFQLRRRRHKLGGFNVRELMGAKHGDARCQSQHTVGFDDAKEARAKGLKHRKLEDGKQKDNDAKRQESRV